MNDAHERTVSASTGSVQPSLDTNERCARFAGAMRSCAWPRAIFFDVGDTLVRARRPFGELLVEVSRQFQIVLPPDAAGGLMTHVDAQMMTRAQQRKAFTFPAAASQQFWFETYHSYLTRLLPQHDATRLSQAIREVLSSPAGYVLYDETLPMLERLRAEGYRLGIISNWEAWLPRLLDAAGLTPFFNDIIISGLCGIEKPDPGIFRLALDTSGCKPEEVVYVGDRPAHDVVPVYKIGILPILLDRSDRYPHDPACHRINSLSELPTALERLRSQMTIEASDATARSRRPPGSAAENPPRTAESHSQIPFRNLRTIA